MNILVANLVNIRTQGNSVFRWKFGLLNQRLRFRTPFRYLEISTVFGHAICRFGNGNMQFKSLETQRNLAVPTSKLVGNSDGYCTCRDSIVRVECQHFLQKVKCLRVSIRVETSPGDLGLERQGLQVTPSLQRVKNIFCWLFNVNLDCASSF